METTAEKELRERLSKVLNAPLKRRGYYDYTEEQIIYTWEEIFFHIGKLTERASERDKTPLEKRLQQSPLRPQGEDR